MIASIRGRITLREPGRAVLETGGIGYLLHIPAHTELALPGPGEEAFLHVHTHVREDALQLFGFMSALELGLFEKLITVSGIGPKLAVAALSGLSPDDLLHAIAQGDTARLSRISGIGKKTAERIILELRDKLGGLPTAPSSVPSRPAVADREREDAISALLNLGYRRREAEAAVEQARTTASAGLEHLLKQALAVLAKRSS